jgi:hypothetical protein
MSEHSRRTGEKIDPLDELRSLRRGAPPGFARRVMDALPARAPAPWPGLLARIWPEGQRWWLPALAGAAAALLAVALFPGRLAPVAPEQVTVRFELHAPSAQSVELLGDFTGWRTGAIQLAGPDATGHWTANVELPPGRHEYIFLVDGREWQTDPRAEIRRSDGFGRENAIVDL